MAPTLRRDGVGNDTIGELNVFIGYDDLVEVTRVINHIRVCSPTSTPHWSTLGRRLDAMAAAELLACRRGPFGLRPPPHHTEPHRRSSATG
jgi:hypothetical protein